MGYDVTRFVNICELLEDELVCVICIGIYENPVIASCDHLFCDKCIQRWLSIRPSCPVCETNITFDNRLKSPPLIIKNILGKLKLHCDYQDDGCKDIVRLDSLVLHTSQCKHRPISVQTKASIKQMFNNFLNIFADRRSSRNVPQARPEIQRNPLRLFRFINEIYDRRAWNMRDRRVLNIHRRDDNIIDERIAHDNQVNQAIDAYKTYLKAFFILILGTYVLAAVIDLLWISVAKLSQFCFEYPYGGLIVMCVFVLLWYRNRDN